MFGRRYAIILVVSMTTLLVFWQTATRAFAGPGLSEDTQLQACPQDSPEVDKEAGMDVYVFIESSSFATYRDKTIEGSIPARLQTAHMLADMLLIDGELRQVDHRLAVYFYNDTIIRKYPQDTELATIDSESVDTFYSQRAPNTVPAELNSLDSTVNFELLFDTIGTRIRNEDSAHHPLIILLNDMAENGEDDFVSVAHDKWTQPSSVSAHIYMLDFITNIPYANPLGAQTVRDRWEKEFFQQPEIDGELKQLTGENRLRMLEEILEEVTQTPFYENLTASAISMPPEVDCGCNRWCSAVIVDRPHGNQFNGSLVFTPYSILSDDSPDRLFELLPQEGDWDHAYFAVQKQVEDIRPHIVCPDPDRAVPAGAKVAVEVGESLDDVQYTFGRKDDPDRRTSPVNRSTVEVQTPHDITEDTIFEFEFFSGEEQPPQRCSFMVAIMPKMAIESVDLDDTKQPHELIVTVMITNALKLGGEKPVVALHSDGTIRTTPYLTNPQPEQYVSRIGVPFDFDNNTTDWTIQADLRSFTIDNIPIDLHAETTNFPYQVRITETLPITISVSTTFSDTFDQVIIPSFSQDTYEMTLPGARIELEANTRAHFSHTVNGEYQTTERPSFPSEALLVLAITFLLLASIAIGAYLKQRKLAKAMSLNRTQSHEES